MLRQVPVLWEGLVHSSARWALATCIENPGWPLSNPGHLPLTASWSPAMQASATSHLALRPSDLNMVATSNTRAVSSTAAKPMHGSAPQKSLLEVHPCGCNQSAMQEKCCPHLAPMLLHDLGHSRALLQQFETCNIKCQAVDSAFIHMCRLPCPAAPAAPLSARASEGKAGPPWDSF